MSKAEGELGVAGREEVRWRMGNVYCTVLILGSEVSNGWVTIVGQFCAKRAVFSTSGASLAKYFQLVFK